MGLPTDALTIAVSVAPRPDATTIGETDKTVVVPICPSTANVALADPLCPRSSVAVQVTVTVPGKTPAAFSVAVIPLTVKLPALLLNFTTTGRTLLAEAVTTAVRPTGTVPTFGVQLTTGGAAACRVSTEDSLLAIVGVPANFACIRCDPALSEPVANTACPLLEIVATPSTVLPSTKVTEPVGVPADALTTVVNVVPSPASITIGEADRTVVVVADASD